MLWYCTIEADFFRQYGAQILLPSFLSFVTFKELRQPRILGYSLTDTVKLIDVSEQLLHLLFQPVVFFSRAE